MLKLPAKKFVSPSRVLYLGEYEPGLYAAIIKHVGVLEDGMACVDPDHPCDKRWLIPSDVEECGRGEIVAVWDPINLLACAEGYCYANLFGVGNEFGPLEDVLAKVKSMRPDLIKAISDFNFSSRVYIPAVKSEECRGRAFELCATSCDIIIHLDCRTVELDAHISRNEGLSLCVKCEGQCPSTCTDVSIDVFKLARNYVSANSRQVVAKIYYTRNALVAVVVGYGALALTDDSDAVVGSVEEVVAWLSDRGRQHLAELILREGGIVSNS